MGLTSMTGRHVTRSRLDIRKYKHTKAEVKLVRAAVDHLNAMKEEFKKGERHYNSNAKEVLQPEFKVVGLNDSLEGYIIKQTGRRGRPLYVAILFSLINLKVIIQNYVID